MWKITVTEGGTVDAWELFIHPAVSAYFCSTIAIDFRPFMPGRTTYSIGSAPSMKGVVGCLLPPHRPLNVGKVSYSLVRYFHEVSKHSYKTM